MVSHSKSLRQKTSPYYVRPMCQEDIGRVAEIDREAFPTQWPPPNYRHELQNQLAYYCVACDETRTVEEPAIKSRGFYAFAYRVRRWFHHNRSAPEASSPPTRHCIAGFAGIWLMANEAHITNVAVQKQYQRQGIGELLLISLIEMANKLNASMLTLEVRASNLAAQSLYRKYGFTEVGVRRAYYLDNKEDAVLMSTESITLVSFQERFHRLKQAYSRKRGITRPAN